LWGAVSALIFLQLQCGGAENCPITIGAYGEDGAPIDNDGQGICYQDYGCVPDSPTHVYHGWGFPAVPPCCCTMPPGSATTSMLIKFQKYLVEGLPQTALRVKINRKNVGAYPVCARGAVPLAELHGRIGKRPYICI
jgi:hypothetical protein